MAEENKKYKKCPHYVDRPENSETENKVYDCEGITKIPWGKHFHDNTETTKLTLLRQDILRYLRSRLQQKSSMKPNQTVFVF